jgi:hypothetical protein
VHLALVPFFFAFKPQNCNKYQTFYDQHQPIKWPDSFKHMPDRIARNEQGDYEIRKQAVPPSPVCIKGQSLAPLEGRIHVLSIREVAATTAVLVAIAVPSWAQSKLVEDPFPAVNCTA